MKVKHNQISQPFQLPVVAFQQQKVCSLYCPITENTMKLDYYSRTIRKSQEGMPLLKLRILDTVVEELALRRRSLRIQVT